MARVIRALYVLLVAFGTSSISGCSPLDVYAFRAVQYNFEAEETQNQVILLNILRSSLHRPMEFTEITSIVGGNSANGNASFNFPVGFRLPTGVTTGTAGGSVGGSTTFTVPVLDTQEFYQGLLNDIQPSLLAYYLQTPFVSKDVVLNLFIERIVVHRTDAECRHSHATTCERDFRNNPTNQEDIGLFQTFINYLLSRQVSAEPVKTKPKSQTIKATGATINISGSSDSSGGGGGATTFRLCFSPRNPAPDIPSTALCGNASPSGGGNTQIAAVTNLKEMKFSPDLAEAMLRVIEGVNVTQPCRRDVRFNDEYRYDESVRAFCNQPIEITLQFRSTGSIFNYLGQIVSEEEQKYFYPLYGRSTFGRSPDTWPPCWITLTDSRCKPIILVRAGGAPALVSIAYAGSLYAVPGPPELSYSPDVFTILKQLVALNLSGKNLPTTAILSVTSTSGP
jgi:hypothetical protein